MFGQNTYVNEYFHLSVSININPMVTYMSNGNNLVRDDYRKNKPLFQRDLGHIWVGKPLWNNGLFYRKKSYKQPINSLYFVGFSYVLLYFHIFFYIFSVAHMITCSNQYRAENNLTPNLSTSAYKLSKPVQHLHSCSNLYETRKDQYRANDNNPYEAYKHLH